MKKNLHIVIFSFLFAAVIWTSISLSEEYYTSFTLPLKLINFPPGYSIGSEVPETIELKVNGTGWKLIGLYLSKDLNYVSSVGTDTGKVSITLMDSRDVNSWLSGDVNVIDIFPPNVSVIVDKVIEESLPVKPNLHLKFRPGYGLAQGVGLDPDSVLVTGSERLIKRQKVIESQLVEYEELDEPFTAQIPLDKPFGLVINPKMVNIQLDIQKFVDKEFIDIPIEVVDIPSDRNVLLIPDKLSVAIRGGIQDLGRLSNDDFYIFARYHDILTDTLGSIQPVIKIPDGTKLINYKPNRIRYIIKKY